jgi:hypothetical protein
MKLKNFARRIQQNQLYISNPYNLVYSSDQSHVSKISMKIAPFILKRMEYFLSKAC